MRAMPGLDIIQSLAETRPEMLAGRGKPVIGWFCSYTPVEILLAAGLHPYRLVPAPGDSITLADSRIERNFCPYARSCLGEALQGRYQSLDGLVVVNSCDAMRRLYDVWRHYVGGKFVTLLDLPRIDSPRAADYYQKRLHDFAGEIEAHYGVKLSSETLRGAIADGNRTRALLRRLYHLSYDRGMPVSAFRVNQIIRASTTAPGEAFTGALESLLAEMESLPPLVPEGPRLLVSGSVMDNPLVLDVAEQAGARVVCDDLCTGTRLFWESPDAEAEPLPELSRHHLGRVPCPRMHDSRRRFDHIFRLIEDFRVGGVILYSLKFCDPFLYDVPVLKDRLAARGIPSLVLDSDYAPGVSGRLKTRVEAFVEMLRDHVEVA